MAKRVKIQSEELKTLYIDNKLSTEKISKIYNCSKSTISYQLKKFKIPARRNNYLKPFKDLTGQRFNKLIAISFLKKEKNGNYKWNCICDCGNKRVASTAQLRSGDIFSCVTCIPKKVYSYKKYEEIPYDFIIRVERGAKYRNIDFNITIEQVWNLFLKQNRKCALSGLDIIFSFKNQNNKIQTASLDRIDSSKGYAIDNIQLVHKNINYIKMDFSQKEFIEYCNQVSEFQKEKYQNEDGICSQETSGSK